MGFLRVYLAACVVVAHAKADLFVGWVPDSIQAVQMFFIISGFYMSLVLAGRYNSLKTFYASRALRIYVPYFFLLALIVGWSVISGWWQGKWLSLEAYSLSPFERNDAAAVILAAGTNLTILGQDVLHFLNGAKGHFLRFTFAEESTGIPLWQFTVMPQAWAVSLELTFYFLVPFLAKLRWVGLAVLALGGLFLRVIAYEGFGLNQDPWIYRFFPFELPIFIFGMLAHELYRRRDQLTTKVEEIGNRAPYIVTVLVLLVIMSLMSYLVNLISGLVGWHYAVFLNLLTFPLWLGLAFAWTKNNRLDRTLGELSFPVYLNHFIVIQTFDAYDWNRWIPEVLRGEAILFLSLGLAWVFYAYWLKPFEAWRHRILGVGERLTPSPAH